MIHQPELRLDRHSELVHTTVDLITEPELEPHGLRLREVESDRPDNRGVRADLLRIGITAPGLVRPEAGWLAAGFAGLDDRSQAERISRCHDTRP